MENQNKDTQKIKKPLKLKLIFAIIGTLIMVGAAITAVALLNSENDDNNGAILVDVSRYGIVDMTISTDENGKIILPEDPVITGYKFGGWYFDKGAWQNPVTENTIITENTTIYAKQTPIQYSITYNGCLTPNNPTTYTIEDSFTLAAPENQSCKFLGWYSDSNLTNEITAITPGTTGALTLYPKWQKHDYTEWTTVDSNECSAVSYRIKLCKVCGHSVLDAEEGVDVIHPHDFELLTKEATCTEGGYEYRFECNRCHFVAAEKITEALGHVLSETYYITGDSEYHYGVCSRCEQNVKETHNFKSWTTVKQPNCYEEGREIGICTKCGFDVERPISKVHNLTYTSTILEPTCTEKGLDLYTCSICGEVTENREVDPLDHDYQYLSTVSVANCVEDGIDIHKCSRCQDEKEVVTKGYEHLWEEEGSIVKYPDCYQTGILRYECTRDTCESTNDVVIPKEHQFGGAEIITEPSCSTEGLGRITCSVCQAKKEFTIPCKHDTTYIPHKDAGCTEDGNEECWYCADCGKYFSKVTKSDKTSVLYDGAHYDVTLTTYSYKEASANEVIIPAHGHSFPSEFDKYDDTHHWNECIYGCGTASDKHEHSLKEILSVSNPVKLPGESNYTVTVTHILTCTECEYSLEGEIDKETGNITQTPSKEIKHEHNLFEVIEPCAPTCTQPGLSAGLACGNCGKVLVEQTVIDALGHNFVNAICTRCGFSKYGTPGLAYTLNSDKSSYSCSGIGTADTPFIVIGSEYNGLPVTSISASAFSGKHKLVSVVIPDTITSIGNNAFYNCYKLVEIYNLSSLKIAKNTSNGYIGNYAIDIYTDINEKSKLTVNNSGLIFYLGDTVYLMGSTADSDELVLPNIFAGKEYSVYQYAFYDSSVRKLTIGLKVKELGEYAFYYCTALEDINFNAIAMDDLSYSNYVFYNAGSKGDGIKVVIGKNVTKIPAYLFYHYKYVKTVEFEEDSVCKSIGNYAFYDCSSLASITIPNSVTSIGNYAFHNCDSLTSVTIGDSVTSIGDSAFSGCTNLVYNEYDNAYYLGNERNPYAVLVNIKSRDIISFTIHKDTKFICNSVFNNCSNLKEVHISDIEAWCNISFGDEYANPLYNGASLYLNGNIISGNIVIPEGVKAIPAYTFKNSNITSITIPNSVTSIGINAFYCSNLKEVHISDIGAWCNISFGDNDANPLYYAKNLYLNGNLITELVIPDTITEIKNYAFYNCDSITNITIPNTVTSVDDYAFAYCSNLISITIPDSVTSIGWNAFSYCSSLTSITIPDSVTSIGEHAFSWCSSLTSVTIGNGVTSIGKYAFSTDSKLIYNEYDNAYYLGNQSNPYVVLVKAKNKDITSCTIHEDTKVIYSDAFYNCSSLTSITIPNSVEFIGHAAFSSCTALEEIYFNATAINDLSSAVFSNAGKDGNGIKVVIGKNVTKIPANFNSSAIITVEFEEGSACNSIGEGAFYNCTSLTSITIPNSVEVIGDSAFYNCTSLTSITIPNSVTSIGRNAFRDCTALEEIYFNATAMDDLSHGNDVFYNSGSKGDVKVVIGKNVTKIPAYLFCPYNYAPKIVSVEFEEGSVCKSIGESAFENCSSLTSITIPDNVTSIGDSAFEDCSSLTSVTIPNSVTSIGKRAFVYCTSLTSVTIPDGVEFIGEYAFCGCSSLKSVRIPNSITSIGYAEFADCTALEEIYFNATATGDLNSNNQYYSHVFSNAGKDGNGIKVVIGKNVTKIPAYLFGPYNSSSAPKIVSVEFEEGSVCKSIGSSAFYKCSNLTNITIPNSVTSIGGGAFSGCSSLEEVHISDIGSWCNISFGDKYANPLYYAKNLYLKGNLITELVIPNTVKEIKDYAFYNRTSLTSITIPNSVTSIGAGAFYNCTALEEIYFNATEMNDLSSSNHVFYNAGKNGNGIKVVIGKNVTKIPAYLFGPYNSSSAPKIVSVEFEEGSVCENIGTGAFSGCSKLTSITIPNSVTSIGAQAFYDCTALKEIYFNATAMNDLSSYNYVFYKAGKEAGGIKVVIGKNVTKIPAYLFTPHADSSYAPKIVSVEFEEGCVCKSIGESAFEDCSNLKEVHISDIEAWCNISFGDSYANPLCYAKNLYLNGNLVTELVIPNTVTEIKDFAFHTCTSLTSITIPDSVEFIGDGAFSGCDKLVEVYNLSNLSIAKGSTDNGCVGLYALNVYTSLDEVSKQWTTDDDFVFYEDGDTCYLLGYIGDKTEITLPESCNGKNYEIYKYAFYKNYRITKVTIPDSIASIGSKAFYSCSNLKNVTIGNSVTSIGGWAFYNCSNLKNVYYTGTAEEWAEISIGSYNSPLTNATKYYYSEEEPTTEGNFWHYDEDGNIVVW